MSSFALRAVPCISLLAALATGCAHSGGPSRAVADVPTTGPEVTAEEIARGPNESIERVLMGRFPGVIVSRTADGSMSVRIRGTTSFLGSNEPLYVIDGVPMQAGINGVLTGLSPYDIQSIKVLKDAVDTTMYGMRGANGVIVITTKRPDQ